MPSLAIACPLCQHSSREATLRGRVGQGVCGSPPPDGLQVVEVSDHEGSEHSGEEIEAGADGAVFDEEHKDEGDSAEESAPEDDDEDGGDDDGVEDDDDEEEDDAL